MSPESLPGWGWATGGFALGAIIGSHIATLLIRWPKGESASTGRSHCDRCGKTLGPIDLVPLISFAVRRGRCGACGGRIDRLHPLIELAAAVIGAIALFLSPGPEGIAGAVLGWLLLALASFDLRHFWLPDRITLALALAGLACAATGLPPNLSDRLIGGAAGFGTLALIGWGYERVRGRRGLGGGDPKLLGALGLWLGWQALPFLLFGASLTGLVAVGIARLGGRRAGGGDPVPFGTLLALAAWPLWLVLIAGAWPPGWR